MSMASLPARERGLKLGMAKDVDWLKVSLPARERGLKRHGELFELKQNKSLPARERGLKLWRGESETLDEGVAPRAGAWIETNQITIK